MKKFFKIILVPWKVLIGFIIIVFMLPGPLILISIPFLILPLISSLIVTILFWIGYIYLFSLWFVCIINADSVFNFALNLIMNCFSNNS